MEPHIWSQILPLDCIEVEEENKRRCSRPGVLQIEEDDDFEAFVNSNTRIEASAVGDANLRSTKKGDILQLERKGFFICDSPFLNESNPLTLLFIPDGRARAPPVEYIESRKW